VFVGSDSLGCCRCKQGDKMGKTECFTRMQKVFAIDKVNAMSAAALGFLDEMTCNSFDPDVKCQR